MNAERHSRWIGCAVVLAAAIVAVLSARPYAGSWNDGSRLATVECLVDYHTLAIDRSIFVQVPEADARIPSPYPPDEPDLLLSGTKDKLFIDGQFYSDKSPVPALLLAGVYQVWEWSTGLTARARPDLFCLFMTLASSGLAYVVAVASVYYLSRALQLSLGVCLLLTTSFGLATVALPYTQYVNNHILLLGVAAPLFWGLTRLAENLRAGKPCGRWPVLVGALAGLGYTIDLGTGPILLAGTGALIVFRCRRILPVITFGLATLPWLVLHHSVNYAVGGTLKPANAVVDYFNWPGCPFNATNMTGGWQHPSVWHFLGYAAELLAGKKGFLGHNPALFLLPVAFVVLARRRPKEWPELLLAVFWSVGAWLAYAATSNNASGLCCSIRWFVPLLAAAYFVLAVLLREQPRWRIDFLVLSAWGILLAATMAWYGPWMKHMAPFYWPIQAGVLLAWGAIVTARRRRSIQRGIVPPRLAEAA
ncbi:MAG TPA: hypothetical protein VGG61_16150 [Gemmataceae bacterium]|jgi:hypothetical protein